MTTFGEIYTTAAYAKSINAQTAVVGDAAAADASAVLDIRSTSQGVLFPRLTTVEMNAVASPAAGLTIYNTTDNGFYYWNGAAWTPISTGEFDTLVVGGGSLDPSAVLQVNSTTGGFALPRMTQAQRDAIDRKSVV